MVTKKNPLLYNAFDSTSIQYILRKRVLLKTHPNEKKKLQELESFLNKKSKNWLKERQEKLQSQLFCILIC